MEKVGRSESEPPSIQTQIVVIEHGSPQKICECGAFVPGLDHLLCNGCANNVLVEVCSAVNIPAVGRKMMFG